MKVIVMNMVLASEGITKKDIRNLQRDVSRCWANRHDGEELGMVIVTNPEEQNPENYLREVDRMMEKSKD